MCVESLRKIKVHLPKANYHKAYIMFLKTYITGWFEYIILYKTYAKGLKNKFKQVTSSSPCIVNKRKNYTYVIENCTDQNLYT